jgi:hypothetical protein
MSARSVRAESDHSASSPTVPTFSIVLPVPNEEAWLERCLSSVAEQSCLMIVEFVVAATAGAHERTSIDE